MMAPLMSAIMDRLGWFVFDELYKDGDPVADHRASEHSQTYLS
jgi:quinol monooxygenase YgiN